MKKMLNMRIVILIILSVIANPSKAQNLSNVPPNMPNTRFNSQDIFSGEIVRPALSVRGFDSSTLQGGANHGLGMKQILEKLMAEDPSVTDIIDRQNSTNDIVGQANQSLKTPSGSSDEKREDLDFNSRVTQSRAFVALAACLITNN